jgi:hypothetical protein
LNWRPAAASGKKIEFLKLDYPTAAMSTDQTRSTPLRERSRSPALSTPLRERSRSISPATPKHIFELSDDKIAEFEAPVIDTYALCFMKTFDNHYTDKDLFAKLTEFAFSYLREKYPGRNIKKILNLCHKKQLTEQV